MIAIVVTFLLLVVLVNLPVGRMDISSKISIANDTSSAQLAERLYFMKRLGGAGCPYTASWFIHVNHFRRVTWWIDITKMEAASFNVFDSAKLKFQLSDPDAYYVHHMSMYEHFNHKKYGFEIAKNKTLILSHAAVQGECDNLVVSKMKNIIAFVPFYGGLPPDVTKDLAVKSIGQGNSLVDASTKALQALATVCSCLKYFGNVVIGVARKEDKLLMIEMITKLDQSARHHINIVQLQMNKPSHLPFHLLAWGQHYVYHHNCWPYYDKSAEPLHKEEMMGFTAYPVLTHRLPNASEYDICYPRSISKYHGGPLKISFVLKNLSHVENDKHSSTGKISSTLKTKHRIPLKFTYYTECDQVVYFDGVDTFNMITSAVNETSFYTGRRKEKLVDSEPAQYMNGLNVWRECGATGYLLRWPISNLVYQEKR